MAGAKKSPTVARAIKVGYGHAAYEAYKKSGVLPAGFGQKIISHAKQVKASGKKLGIVNGTDKAKLKPGTGVNFREHNSSNTNYPYSRRGKVLDVAPDGRIVVKADYGYSKGDEDRVLDPSEIAGDGKPFFTKPRWLPDELYDAVILELDKLANTTNFHPSQLHSASGGYGGIGDQKSPTVDALVDFLDRTNYRGGSSELAELKKALEPFGEKKLKTGVMPGETTAHSIGHYGELIDGTVKLPTGTKAILRNALRAHKANTVGSANPNKSSAVFRRRIQHIDRALTDGGSLSKEDITEMINALTNYQDTSSPTKNKRAQELLTILKGL